MRVIRCLILAGVTIVGVSLAVPGGQTAFAEGGPVTPPAGGHAAPPMELPSGPPKLEPVGPTEVTEVHGDIPDTLQGTWFMLMNAKIDEQHVINGWHGYRFTKTGSQWQVNELVGNAPAVLQKAIDEANAKGETLTPSPELLASILKAIEVSKLRQPIPQFRANKIYIRTRENFVLEDPFKDPTKGVVFDFELLAQGPKVVIAGNSYYVKEVTKDKMSGEMVSASIAHAPNAPVVPVNLSGPFTMYRLQ